MAKNRDLAVFCQKMKLALHSGFDIEHALLILQDEQIRDLGAALRRTHEGVRRGMQLNAAMRKDEAVYTPTLVDMVYVTEQTGHMELAFERMAKRFEDKDSTKRKLITSAIYPIIVALVFLIAVFAVAASWHMMGLAYGVAAVYAIVIVSAFSFFHAGKNLGRSTMIGGQILLHIPILGKNILQSELADFAGNMAVFYASGVDIDRGMEYSMKTIRYALLREKIAKAANTVRKGIALSDALQMQEIFPPDLIHCLRVGENTGNADGMLQKISEYYSTDVHNRREILMTVLRQ